ncbi:hypothetical protein [Gimibacter soli]|uniref:Uncharacterized protein n=1 Tax=Gimibacter soli TaxID=3024400 RepID=A0AAF0BJQ8_9PROT|nr:hypothetical protein [Gimibacter soli]WCL53384.1 hypothetical protein PH603_12630 [Gimibacter soli]
MVLFVAGIGLSLWALAATAPRLLAHLNLATAQPYIEMVNRGEMLSPDERTILVEASRAALDWAPLAEPHLNLGALYVAELAREEDPVTRRIIASEAANELEAGLALRPLYSYGWMRLAVARSVLLGQEGKAVDALRSSLLTGPLAYDLMVPRLELGRVLLPSLTPADLDLLRQQTMRLYHAHNDTLRLYAVRMERLDWVSFLLGHDPKAQTAFLKEFVRE